MTHPGKLFLLPSERDSLKALHRANQDKRICDRIKAILLLDNGWSFDKVATALLLDSDTIRRYYKTYAEGGKEALLVLHYSGKLPKLNIDQIEKIKAYVKEIIPSSAKEVVKYIKDQFGVEYSESAVVLLLHRLGFVYKKPKLVPGKADPEKQEIFLEELDDLKDSLGDEDRIIYMDGVHPQHNSKPAYGWMEKGKDTVLKSNAGRERININGAIDTDTLEVSIEVDDAVNAQSTIALFKQLEEKYPAAKRIVIICDNARYYRSKLVKGYLESSRIEIKFLPPYAPNLNLIERLWRFMNKKIRDNKYYEKFIEFKTAVFEFFENIQSYRGELDSLLKLNFTIIKS
jgi:transposase